MNSFVFAQEKEAGIYCLISFNINLQHSIQDAQEDIQTIKRHIKLMQKYNIKADYYFTWSALKQLIKVEPNLIKIIKDAGMDIHHHGANRPPRPQLIDRIKGEDWNEDVGIVEEYELHDINPQTGQLLSAKGGLSKLKDYSDEGFFSTGRFFQSSILYVCKKFGAKMCVGLKDNTGVSRDDAWFMGVLNRPSDFGIGFKVFSENRVKSVITRLEDMIKKRVRNKPFFFSSPIHDYDFFQKDRRGLSQDEQEKIWQNYESLWSWIRANPEIEVINMREVYEMAIDDRNRNIQKNTIIKLAEIISEVKSYLPEFLDLGDDYFSLNDTFQAFVEALKYYYDNKTLPESVFVQDLLGPTDEFEGITNYVTIKESDLLGAVNKIKIKEEIPAQISVGSLKLNPAEFLVLMAKELFSLSQENKLEDIELHSVEMIPEGVLENQKADKLTKLQSWTFKPARW